MKILKTPEPVFIEGQKPKSPFAYGQPPLADGPRMFWTDTDGVGHCALPLEGFAEAYVPDRTQLWVFTPERAGGEWFWKPQLGQGQQVFDS